MIISLYIEGDVKVEGHLLDKTRFYHITKTCSLEVPEDKKSS